ncbi:hypothetical protein TNCV_987001 [Trichonephila clavipes]|nr:hypothetical protein TNCV_987001 [Trichonephila clavipes]
MAIDEGSRHFKLWSSEERTTPELAPYLQTSTPHQSEDVLASIHFTCIGLHCTAGHQRCKTRTHDMPATSPLL